MKSFAKEYKRFNGISGSVGERLRKVLSLELCDCIIIQHMEEFGTKSKICTNHFEKDALDFQWGMQVSITISGTEPRCS